MVKEKLRQFMMGRYGQDDLGRVLSIASLGLMIIGVIALPALSYIGIAMLIYEYFRMFSRNINKRSQENMAFLKFWGRIKAWFYSVKQRFAQSKTHRFYKCPQCKQTLRVPKGLGRINISCKKCGHKFTKTS